MAKHEVLNLPDGSRYEGATRDGKPYGRGVMTNDEGDGFRTRIEGMFKDGEPYGKCKTVSTLPGGARFEGMMKDGEPFGECVLTLPDGSRVEGTLDEEKDGDIRGVRTNPDGSRFEGTFNVMGGPKDGKGVLTNPYGWLFEATDKDGEPLDTPPGAVAGDWRFEGTYKDGDPYGKGVLMLGVGIRYEGEFAECPPWPMQESPWNLSGYGGATFPNGDCYEGEFDGYDPKSEDEYPNGKGVLVKPDGTRYVGEFEDDGRAGRGVVTYPDGRRYIGEWLDGEPVDVGD